jgi:hypothetical protein
MLDFNGTNSSVSYGDITTFDGVASLSVAFWLKLDTALATADNFMGRGDNSTKGWMIRSPSSGNRMAFQFGGSFFGYWTYSDTTNMHHIAFVYDGSQATDATKLIGYQDGVAQTLTFSSPIPTTIPSDAGGSFKVGDALGTSASFDGQIGNLIITTAIWTPDQVLRQVYKYLPVDTSGLVLFSPYDDEVNAGDYSPNNRTATVSNSSQNLLPPIAYPPHVLTTPRRSSRRTVDATGHTARNMPRYFGPALIPRFQQQP